MNKMYDTQANSEIQPISNKAFLQAIFGDERRDHAYTTSFIDDPLNADRSVWSGKWFIQHFAGCPRPTIEEGEYNNYFVISTFDRDPSDPNPYRRRKDLFEQCYLVVVDDVKAKVDEATLQRLGFPQPSYRLETSPGNEQWGYIFSQPVPDRIKIEYLLDSWVNKGISCDGKDPGMKGVTRYVRLPIGSNTKAAYGEPFRHRLLAWHPERRFPFERLAEMTGVDLERLPEFGDVRPQMILSEDQDELLQAINEAGLLIRKNKPGVYEITCPWVHEHTQRANTGAAYIQPAGFKCHHGSCAERHGRHLIKWLRAEGHLHTLTPEEMFAEVRPPVAEGEVPAAPPEPQVAAVCYVDSLDKFLNWREDIFYSRAQMDAINPTPGGMPPYTTVFFEERSQIGINRFKRLTYMPGKPRNYNNELNTWIPGTLQPMEGDVGPWLNLAKRLFPDPLERHHIMSWLAYTVQHPSEKINHCLLIVGPVQGQGKDTFIDPVITALGRHNCTMVFPKEFHGGYNDFLKNRKLLVVQEVMDFGKAEAEHYLKPLLAAPPTEVAISEKYVGRYMLPNVWNFIMFSNEVNAAKVAGGDRRYFCVRTDAPPLGDLSDKLWEWYQNSDGEAKVYHYLLNYDTSYFSPKKAPLETEFKREMIKNSRGDIGTDLDFVLSHEAPPFYPDMFTLQQLRERFHLLRQLGKVSRKEWSVNALGNILSKENDFSLRRLKISGKAVRVWVNSENLSLQNEKLRGIWLTRHPSP